ncbi:MAG: SEL1-like repeat protein [Kiritimatiellae bacterium]|nr:SEL1-like repeat protein [Kiritimatiellia bacterium]
MKKLYLHGHARYSIKDIEEHFDEVELKRAVRRGSLAAWLRERLENEMADRVNDIAKALAAGEDADFQRRLVEALGLNAKVAADSAKRIAEEQAEKATEGMSGETVKNAIPDPDQVGDVGQYFPRYQREAKKGDAMAQYGLGICYYLGKGVAEDKERGASYFREAAKQGHERAAMLLGHYYLYGWGGKKDAVEAVKWIRMAAEKGDKNAQCLLGECYREGTGEDKNDEEAEKWFRLAANQGVKKAQCHLGMCSLPEDEGCPNEIEAVRKWFQAEAEPEQENEEARRQLDDLEEFVKGFPGESHDLDRAQEYADRVTEEQVDEMVNKEEEMKGFFQRVGVLKKYWTDVCDTFSLLKDRAAGKYCVVNWPVIASLIGALVYVFSPVDAIPDVIPFVGFLDDTGVFAAVLAFAGKDLEQYREWRRTRERAVDVECEESDRKA